MAFAIKAEIRDAQAAMFAFTAQKTMYGGKEHRQRRHYFHVRKNEGGRGLIALGVVTFAEAPDIRFCATSKRARSGLNCKRSFCYLVVIS